MEKNIAQYYQDYEKYMTKESKDKAVGMPFLIKGKKRGIGVVLIHGYMAAPTEVKELAEYLGKRGIWVYVPRVKGHGTSPDDLAAQKYSDWIDSADEGYAIIDNLCDTVVVGGFSNGAGLALDLAHRVKNVKGVFAVCPPMRLKDLATILVPAVDSWNKFMEWIRLDSAQMEFVDNRPENPHINYIRNPVSGVRELERLMNYVEDKLPDIKIPALVVQANRDPVVNPKGSRKLYKKLGSKEKEYILFNFQRHGILMGEGSEKVHNVIGDFVENIEKVEKNKKKNDIH
jgi:esterase/lipase